MNAKELTLASLLIFHYGIVIFFGQVFDWGFVGSLLLGTFFIFLGLVGLGGGLVGPITIAILIIAGLGFFNILWIVNIITGASVAAFLLASD
jgi:hypothetical protein